MNAWEFASWDAVETRARLERREVSAEEVVTAALERAHDAASLNALVTLTADRALTASRAAPHGELFGVPTAVKDLSQLAGVRTTWGSAASGVYVSPKSDPAVAALEATGLISIGKSATPEFGLTATTEPLAFAPCHNPWAPGHSSGGSSGGAAALVASGVLPMAHASDGGGSIRIPASCCGLVGLKPSRGRLDMEGSNLLPVNIAGHGVLSRTVRDTVAFWRAIEHHLPRRRMAPIGEVAARPRRLRVGVFVDSALGFPVDPEVVAVVHRAADHLANLGHDVARIACPFEAKPLYDFLELWAFVAFSQSKSAPWFLHRGFDPAKLEPLTVEFSRTFSGNLRRALPSLWRLRSYGRTWAELFTRYDVVVSPTLAQPPPAHGHLATDVPLEQAVDRLLRYTPFTAPANLAGAPAMSLPLGHSEAGLPIGVHFAAAVGHDRLLLELASELEAAHPWPLTAPRTIWSHHP